MDRSRDTEDEKIGVEIVRWALEESHWMIAQNEGAEGYTERLVREACELGGNRPDRADPHCVQNTGLIVGLLLTTEHGAIGMEKSWRWRVGLQVVV